MSPHSILRSSRLPLLASLVAVALAATTTSQVAGTRAPLDALRYGDASTGVLAPGAVGLREIHLPTAGSITVSLTTLPDSEPGFAPSWALVDPRGAVLRLPDGRDDVACSLPGTYSIVVFDRDRREAGAFALDVHAVSAGLAGGRRILAGESRQESTLIAGWRADAWAIELEEGQRLEVDVDALDSTAEGFHPVASLFSPDGRRVEGAAGPGMHTLLVHDDDRGQAGAYVLRTRLVSSGGGSSAAGRSGPGTLGVSAGAQRDVLPAGPAKELQFGDSCSGSIAAPGEVDLFRFDARANDELVLRWTRTTSVNLLIRVHGPRGGVVAQASGAGDDLIATLPATGTYLLSVRATSGGTGSYALTLQRTVDPGNVAPIAYGDTVAGTFPIRTEVDVYELSGLAGETFVARYTRTNANGRVQICVRDEAGQLLACSPAPNIAGDFEYTLPTDGRYFLWIQEPNRAAPSPVYEVSLRRTTAPANAQPIQCGDTMSGSFAFRTEVDVFEVSAVAGESLYMRYTRTNANGRVQILVRNAAGQLLASSPAGATGGDFQFDVPADGTYYLWLQEPNRAAPMPVYELSLQCLAAPANTQPIHFGDTVSGTFGFQTEMDVFELNATQGETMVARYTRTNANGRVQIWVHDDAGTRLDSSNASLWEGDYSYTFPADGKYTLWLVEPNRASPVSIYELTLRRTVEPVNTMPIAYGGTVSNTLTFRTEVDVYELSASPGERIYARYTRTNTNGRVQLVVYDAAGTELARTSSSATEGELELTLTGTAPYFLWIQEPNRDAPVPVYELSLYRTSSPLGATPVVFGDTVASTFALRTQAHVYELSAAGGETLFAPYTRTNGFGRVLLCIRDGSGNELGCSPAANVEGDFEYTFPSTGTYYLWVEEPNRDAPVPIYEFSLQSTTNPGNTAPIAVGQALAGSVSNTEIDVYTFSGSSGDSRTVSVTGGLELRVYDASGTLRAGPATGSLSLQLPVTGGYAIWVRNASHNTPVSYTVDLQ